MSKLDKGFISTITIHELTYGIERLPKGERKDKLTQTIQELLQKFERQIIPITQQEAKVAGILRAKTQATGKKLHLADSLIAASAEVHLLTIVTRNTKDFDGLHINLNNPWK